MLRINSNMLMEHRLLSVWSYKPSAGHVMSVRGTCGVPTHLVENQLKSRLAQVVKLFVVLNMQTRFASFASHYSLMKKN